MVKLAETAIFKKIMGKVWAVKYVPGPLALLLHIVASVLFVKAIWKTLWVFFLYIFPQTANIETVYLDWFFNAVCCFAIAVSSIICSSTDCRPDENKDKIDYFIIKDDGELTYCGRPAMRPIISRFFFIVLYLYFSRQALFIFKQIGIYRVFYF